MKLPTLKMLVKACADQRAGFKRLFGESVGITEALCVEHAHYKATGPARDALDEATALVWAAHYKAIAPARDPLDEACATDQVAAYRRALAAAQGAYLEAHARAVAQVFGSTENQS